MKQLVFAVLVCLSLSTLIGGGVTTARAASEQAADASSYIPINPALIVNLATDARPHFLKVGIELYVRTAEAAAIVDQNMPLIRDRLITYFAGREFDEVSAIDKRESLRLGALETIQKALTEKAGAFAVDGLYFDDFIIQ